MMETVLNSGVISMRVMNTKNLLLSISPTSVICESINNEYQSVCPNSNVCMTIGMTTTTFSFHSNYSCP